MAASLGALTALDGAEPAAAAAAAAAGGEASAGALTWEEDAAYEQTATCYSKTLKALRNKGRLGEGV